MNNIQRQQLPAAIPTLRSRTFLTTRKRRRPATIDLRAAHVRFSLGAAAAIVLLISPTLAEAPNDSYRWGRPILWDEANGPEAREHGSVIVDEQGGRVILIGGSGYNPYLTPLADVWQFSLTSDKWTPLKSGGAIPIGGSRRVAQIPGQKVAYLFGGYLAGAKTHNELIRVDYADHPPTFANVSQDAPPPPRAMHAFVYDEKANTFILFGGVTVSDAGSKINNDVWTMKLVNGRALWTKLELSSSPSPRYGFFYGYDSEDRRLIVFSGAQAGSAVDPAQDTWLLSLRDKAPRWTRWTKSSPPGRRNGCFVYDQSEHRLFIFGGTKDGGSSEPDLWVFDARPAEAGWKAWPLADSPALRSSSFGFIDRPRNRILMGFGNGEKPYRDLFPLMY